MTRLSRATDPSSSAEAAERHVASGRNATQKIAVLEALRAHPGATSAELARSMKVDRYITARRLPDLERDGRVTRIGERTCRVDGTPAVIWKAR